MIWVWVFVAIVVVCIVGFVTYALLDAAKSAQGEDEDEDSWGI